jgi:glycosyltransferase involved in cell wall biosynthesis
MKVLFSNPPWWIENPDAIFMAPLLSGVRAGSRWPFTTPVRSRPDHYRFGDYLPYPFFLGAAASYLAQATGAAVDFRDSLALRDSYQTYFAFLQAQRFDYIVIESASPSWGHDAGLIARIKTLCPHSKIVLTGPIAVRGEALLADHPLHAVIQGEYEKGCVRVVGGARGLLPHDLLTEAELNAAPFPFMDALHAHRYWDSNPRGQRAPQAQVLSSRGCPFRCIFCVWPATMTGNDPDGQGPRPVRQYTADHMEGLLRDLVGRFGYQSIYFDDDTFNLGDRHVLDMCGVMMRLGLPWSAMCRADTISRDTWKHMREAGCFGVKIGFESGNQWVVDNIVRKNLDLAKAKEVVLHLKDLGFAIHGTFTVGLPGETTAQRQDTRRYRASLPLDSFQESGAAAIEGAPLASLGRTGQLSRYPGANAAGYIEEGDGTTKLQKLSFQGLTLADAARQWRQGHPALAEAICHNLLAGAVTDAAVLDLLGTMADQAGKPALAARFFCRALALAPELPGTLVTLGNLLHNQGLPEEAARCYQRALAVKPDCDGALIGLDLLIIEPHVPSSVNKAHQDAVRRELSDLGSPLLAPDPSAVETPKNPGRAQTPPSGLRLIVLDHGMRFVPGHHLMYNTGLLIECVKRNLPVQFYVHTSCHTEVVSALRAKPVLRPARNTIHSNDEFCGYFEEYYISSRLAEYNLRMVFKDTLEPTDIVFIHTADPKIVLGLAAWYKTLPADRQPILCLKFQNHGYKHVLGQYQVVAQSLFRSALKPFIGMDKVHLAASNARIAEQIEHVAEKPCPVFPIPLQIDPPKIRTARRSRQDIRIGYCGEGRPEQGVTFLPGIVEEILATHPGVQFTIQFGCNFVTKEILHRLRESGDRVVVQEHCYVGQHFYDLLRSFDALLLPYDPNRYIDRSSQLVVEAIALGVPVIVPARSSLAFEAQRFDCGYSLFETQNVPSIVAAIGAFLADRQALAQKSALAAKACADFHNAPTLVDMLLAACLPGGLADPARQPDRAPHPDLETGP